MGNKILAYTTFLRNIFTIGLHQTSEDSVLLSLMTPEREKEAELFAEYLLDHPNQVETLVLFSWEDIQKELQKKTPLFDTPSKDPFSGFFQEYLEHLN